MAHMTPDPRDELAALNSARVGATRADTDAFLDAARVRPQDLGDTAFLPLAPEDAERQRIQKETVATQLTREQLDAYFEQMLYIPPPRPDRI